LLIIISFVFSTKSAIPSIETVIDLDLQEDGSVKVTNPYSRGYRFDDFTFDIDKNALPYLVE